VPDGEAAKDSKPARQMFAVFVSQRGKGETETFGPGDFNRGMDWLKSRVVLGACGNLIVLIDGRRYAISAYPRVEMVLSPVDGVDTADGPIDAIPILVTPAALPSADGKFSVSS
jgi:hypothetical protein